LRARALRSKILAGGTDLIAGVRAGKLKLPENVIDISHLKELNSIEEQKSYVNIGAASKLSQILLSSLVRSRVLS